MLRAPISELHVKKTKQKKSREQEHWPSYLFGQEMSKFYEARNLISLLKHVKD